NFSAPIWPSSPSPIKISPSATITAILFFEISSGEIDFLYFFHEINVMSEFSSIPRFILRRVYISSS
ncbi:MAG: hypothetical protein RIB86_09555, partial [Imperialibacter sp.]